MSNLYQNIPKELQALKQWICWRYEDIGARKPTKVPYTVDGKMASVNDPDTWGTFDEAIRHVGKYSGIGFVFTDVDPYTFIDLDDTEGNVLAYNRQIQIFREFDSYSEVSPSNRGLHIIVKGKVPAGRRRNFIEIYSSQRYATFTGNIYHNKSIIDCQDKLMQLWEQMGSGQVATNIYKGDDNEKFDDKAIIEQAASAVNGNKFRTLIAGKWQELYPSQSEADLALIDILAFYTQNRNQIIRIFKSSELGKRDKSSRDSYINRMINLSFDQMLPPIDFDGFKIALEEKLFQQNQLKLPLENGDKQPPQINERSINISLPPGLVGEIAQFIYAAAPRPVPQIALAAAIGLMAGICGRAYNVSGTGLNSYVLLLGMTGVGKESMASGIDKLMNSIRLQVPTSPSFMGPSEIASGQALLKHLHKVSQCFVSILGEFGYRIESLSHHNANAAERNLKRMFLDLYNKSGHGQVFRPSIYADADKNIQSTEAPSFSILAESTPETFYGALNENMISDGLLPRFILIEYLGFRPQLSTTHLTAVPSMMLIDKFASLVASVEQIMYAKRVVNVAQSPEALALTESFDKYADAQINGTDKEVIRQLWNRAHIKILKLSALIAVGVNMVDPIILPDYVQWSIEMVQSDIRALSKKFEQGEVGTNTSEIKQQYDLIRIIKEFLTKPWEYCTKYCQGKNLDKLHTAKVIPYVYLNKRLMSMASFKNDRAGATNGLKRAIQILLDSDKIREINKAELAVKHGTSQRAFVVSDMTILED